MTVEARLTSLEEKHLGLEAKISQEFHRPAPDQSKLRSLKIAKLRIREEMQRLQA